MAKSVQKMRKTLNEKLAEARSTGYREGYRRGDEAATAVAEHKYSKQTEEFRRLELARSIISQYGQTFDAMSRAVQAVLGVL